MEFQEVMKQWLRMCKAYPQCEVCKLSAYDELGYKYSCHENGIPCNVDRVELVVIAWAKEHPEPVYPTWLEYLTDMYHSTWYMIKDTHIPADIAEKLGLEPKESRA